MNKTPKKKKSALRVISMSNKKVTEIYKKKKDWSKHQDFLGNIE